MEASSADERISTLVKLSAGTPLYHNLFQSARDVESEELEEKEIDVLDDTVLSSDFIEHDQEPYRLPLTGIERETTTSEGCTISVRVAHDVRFTAERTASGDITVHWSFVRYHS